MKLTKRILVIDDHELILFGIRMALKSTEQYQLVHESKSSVEAWEHIQTQHQDIDIVLSDISLPVWDGIQLCRKIRQEYPQITVVLYSINDSPRLLQDAISAGASGFIKKGSSKDAFLSSLNKVVETGNNFSHEALYQNRIQAKKEKQKPNLTNREKQILELVAKQYTSEEIARQLNLKKSTVDTHRSNMMQKFDVRSSLGLMVEAFGLKFS